MINYLALIVTLNGLLFYILAHQYHKQHQLTIAKRTYHRTGHLEDDDLIKERFGYHHSVNIVECYSLKDIRWMLALQQEINNRGLEQQQEQYLSSYNLGDDSTI